MAIVAGIIGLIVFGVVLYSLLKGVEEAPQVMTIDDLIREGMSPSEARREQREQRREQRQHSITKAQAYRAANALGKSVTDIVRKSSRK